MFLKAMNTAIWKMGEACKRLPDGDTWLRADPRLLSFGELATHIAHWEAKSFFGDSFESPFLHAAARYYSGTLKEPFS